MKNQKTHPTNEHSDALGPLLSVALGATVLSMVVSFSTHHMTVATHDVKSLHDLSHAFEREREVLHAHANLGRVRYPVASGNAR